MFRQIPIGISVGSQVLVLTPVVVPSNGLPVVEFIHSVVVKVKSFGSDKWIYIEDPRGIAYIKIPEWRVVRYTYGGIWLDNYKFDQARIDAQNINIIAQHSNKSRINKNPSKKTNPAPTLKKSKKTKKVNKKP